MREFAMPAATSPISLRLPKAERARLDRAAAKTRRSRSYLVQEALAKYLDDIEREEAPPAKKRLTTLLSLAGAGASETSPRSLEEINRHIRWLRDNE